MKELFHMKEKDEPKENTKLAFAEMQVCISCKPINNQIMSVMKLK